MQNSWENALGHQFAVRKSTGEPRHLPSPVSLAKASNAEGKHAEPMQTQGGTYSETIWPDVVKPSVARPVYVISTEASQPGQVCNAEGKHAEALQNKCRNNAEQIWPALVKPRFV